MTYLLDTHVLIWMMEGDERLSHTAKEVIIDRDKSLKVSIVSFWEMSIKRSLRKLTLRHDSETFWNEAQKQGLDILNISLDHLICLEKLPFQHRDPFDRLLIAQTQSEGYTLISNDQKFHRYSIQTFW